MNRVEEIRKAVLDMMSKVSYEDRDHVYKRKDNGAYLQGVSSVSSIVPKPWLSAWGAKECAKFLGYSDYGDKEKAIKIKEKIEKLTPEKYIALLKEAKGACRRKSKEALVDGTVGHEWLENYIKAKTRGEEPPEIPQDNLKRPITQWLEWEKKNVDTWILSEAIVSRIDKGYAGTLDAMAILKDGRLALIDFKFSNHISEDYYLQTAGYQATFEPYGIKVDTRIIIRLPKTLTREEYDKKNRQYKKVENSIEVVEVETDYENDRDVFFHCLPVKAWINKIINKK